MPIQTLPEVARQYQRQQIRENKAAVLALRRLWRRMGNDFDSSWDAIRSDAVRIVETAQTRVVGQAEPYVASTWAELGGDPETIARANPAGLIGVTGAGWALNDALDVVTIRAKQFVSAGSTSTQALGEAGRWLTREAGTAISDAGRGSEQLSMAARPAIKTYVRMLTPPSCSRCAILAGSTWHTDTAFQRHPRCDCRNIPAPESTAGDLTVDENAYFESMSRAEQDRVFTKEGAEAIRNGAGIGRVVNARRGMTVSQSGRLAKDAHGYYTTGEGITRRGLYGASQGSFLRNGGRYRVAKRERLMPEGIRQVAKDHDEYIRLLKLYKYLL